MSTRDISSSVTVYLLRSTLSTCTVQMSSEKEQEVTDNCHMRERLRFYFLGRLYQMTIQSSTDETVPKNMGKDGDSKEDMLLENESSTA